MAFAAAVPALRGLGAAVAQAFDSTDEDSPVWSPDSKMLLWSDRLMRLRYVDVTTKQVTLVDQQLFHIWKPSLHEVAAGTLDIHQGGLSYEMLAHDNRFTFCLGAMASLDLPGKQLGVAAVLDEHGEELVPARTLADAAKTLTSGPEIVLSLGAYWAVQAFRRGQFMADPSGVAFITSTRPANGEKNLDRLQRWREICPEIVVRSFGLCQIDGSQDDVLAAVEQITGSKILGHRAPFFSITKKSLWALDILGEPLPEPKTCMAGSDRPCSWACRAIPPRPWSAPIFFFGP